MKQLAYPYYRVSTQRQGKSGLGLAAQKMAVEAFAKANGFSLGKAYYEIESGRKNKRPILARALQSCQSNHGTLLIAKLDRLSRNLNFITNLIEAGIEFRAVDIPFASKLVLHILAAVAEHEADAIRTRTREAFAAARRKGKVYGDYAREVTGPRNRQMSQFFALNMRLTIYRLKKEGFTTMRAMSDELNRRRVPTYYAGHRWHPATVCNLLHHIERLKMDHGALPLP